MKPQSLEEFAQELRLKGDWREAEFADEILTLLDLEEEVAEPYSNICADLDWKAPKELEGKPEKIVEYLGDRAAMLDDIEEALKEAGREPEGRSDTADAIKELLGTMEQAEGILEAAGWPGDGDFIEGIQTLADRPEPPAPMEYDL